MHYPYRFKTEEEFIKAYSNNWRDRIRYGWSPNMNRFFGKPYKYNINILSPLLTINDEYGRWTISWHMLTENIRVPNYKPRKIIRK